MWLVYGLLVIIIVAFHAALYFVIKAGLAEAQRPESPSAKNRAPKAYPVGFHRPFQSPLR